MQATLTRNLASNSICTNDISIYSRNQKYVEPASYLTKRYNRDSQGKHRRGVSLTDLKESAKALVYGKAKGYKWPKQPKSNAPTSVYI